jgi:hypothetical protein
MMIIIFGYVIPFYVVKLITSKYRYRWQDEINNNKFVVIVDTYE